MKTINVYENIDECLADIENKKLKRGDDCYIFAQKPKIKKDIHLYRITKDKFSKELVLNNY